MEDSLRLCQILLEQSPLPNKTMTWLQKGVASERYTADEAKAIETSVQREFKILRENLRIFESESQVKVFQAISDSTNRPSEDVSMAAARHDEISDLMRLKVSLEAKLMKEQLENLSNLSRIASLAKICEDQKSQLQEKYLISKEIIKLGRENVSLSNKIKEQLLDMSMLNRALGNKEEENHSQAESILNYKEEVLIVQKRLESQTEQIERLSCTVTEMENTFELAKNVELENCKQYIEEQFENEISALTEELASHLSRVDSMKIKYRESLDKCCLEETKEFCSEQVDEKLEETVWRLERNNHAWRCVIKDKMWKENQKWKHPITDKLEKDNEEWKSIMREKMEKDNEKWKCFMREKMETNNEKWKPLMSEKMKKNNETWRCFMKVKQEKKLDAFKNFVRQTVESELKEEFQRAMDIMVSLAKQACIGEQGLARQAVIEEVLADAKKQWQEHERGNFESIQQLTEERVIYRSKLSSNHDELSECKQKLHTVVSELKRIIFLSEAPPLPFRKRDKKKINALLTRHGEMLQKSDADKAQMPLKKQSESDEQIIRQFTSKVLKMEAKYLGPFFKTHICKDARQQVEDKEKEEKMKRRRLKQKERSQQKLQVGEDQYDIQ